MARSSQLLCLIAAASCGLASAAPGAFLAQQQVDLLSRLEEVLGSDHRQATEARIGRITRDLEATFQSLPKNDRGALDSSAVRYAIHRYFIQRHGWQINGLAPAGQAWSSSSPVAALGHHMSDHEQNVFEEHLSTHGFDLHEAAALAATLENLIHGEAAGNLRTTYAKLKKDEESTFSADDAMGIVDTYLQAIVLSYNISEMSSEMVARMGMHIDKMFPYWNDAKTWLREVQRDVAPDLTTMGFSDVARIVEAVSERYGSQSDKDCQDIQDKLVLLDGSGTGRVNIRDFYDSVNKRGFWNFRESVEYLNHAGAIDDSDPSVPRVIIPNYLQLESNCLTPSSYFAICCMDRCESKMDHLEGAIRAPHASPDLIISLVSSLPPASGPANWTLPSGLVRKLEEVAEHHGGVVPLHGRLFSQWMHFAYPQECAYPHVSNTTGGMSSEEWVRSTGLKSRLTKTEVAAFAETLPEASDAQPCGSEGDDSCMLLWVPEEELVDALNWKSTMEVQRRQQQPWAWEAFSGRQALGLLALLTLTLSSAMALRDFVSRAVVKSHDKCPSEASGKPRKVLVV